MIAAATEGGYGRKRQIKIATDFVRGYISGIVDYLDEGDEVSRQMRVDNSPALVRAIIEDKLEKRPDWLADDYHDEYRRGFRADDTELIPVTSRCAEFQEVVTRMIDDNGIDVPKRAGDMRVKDVAVRRGQGTASLGLERYYLLIEGPNADGSDDLVIEMKQARRSALAGLVPPSEFGVDGRGDRIVHAQRVQLVHGDVFYSHVDFQGLSFMTRERAPFRGSADLDGFSKAQWQEYARICGGALAHAHALSDEVGHIDHDLEPQIVDAIGVRDLFVDDILRYAAEATERAERDHEYFRADHALGAFRSVDLVYR